TLPTFLDRWPAPAQRAYAAVHHRGLSGVAQREHQGAYVSPDRRARRLLRTLVVRTLSRPAGAQPRRGGFRIRAGQRPGGDPQCLGRPPDTAPDPGRGPGAHLRSTVAP